MRSAKDFGLEALDFVYDTQFCTWLSLDGEGCFSACGITTTIFKFSLKTVWCRLFQKSSLVKWEMTTAGRNKKLF